MIAVHSTKIGNMSLVCFALSALIAFGPSANAQDSGSDMSTCDVMAGLGKMIMTDRQNGQPLSQVTKKYKGMWEGKGLPPDVEELLQEYSKRLIIQAYDQPRFTGASYQRNEITEFENSIYLRCLKSQ